MLPNILTIARLILVPVVLALAYSEGTAGRVAALALFLLAAVTDLLDGYLARKYGQVTPFGTLMDPLTDKMLVLGALFVFADLGLLPMWLALVNLFRELLISGIRQLKAARGEVMGANWTGKLKFNLQVVLVAGILLYQALESAGVAVPGGRGLIFWSAAAVTALSVALLLTFLARQWRGLWASQGQGAAGAPRGGDDGEDDG